MGLGFGSGDAKKKQADFFSNMQTMFLGEPGEDGGTSASGGIVGQLKAAADDLRAASDMMRQSASAQPTYGGPNGGRPVMPSDQSRRRTGPDYADPSMGYGSLRRTLASEAGLRYGSTGGVLTRGNIFRPHYDQHGQVEYYDEIDPQGNYVGLHGKDSPVAKATYAKQQRATSITQAAYAPTPFSTTGHGGAVATPGVSTAQHIAQTALGWIPGVGKTAAGIISGLLGAPDAVLNGIVNQRAKNAQYQAILGGTNWGTGTHNRWLEEGFKLSQLYSGGLTGDMSVQAFRGVTGLGYTGDLRNNSLGLITSNYKNLGMGVDESMKFITLMSQTSNVAFEELKTALNEVGDAAKSTGQNLEIARASFANVLGAVNAATGGQGAVPTAALISTYQGQLGRNFANVNLTNLAPGVNPGLTALQASSVGMTMSQYEMTVASGSPQGRALFQRAAQNLTGMAVAPQVGLVAPVIRQMIQKYGGIGAITASPRAYDDFVKKVMQDPAFINSGVNIMSLKAQIKAYTGADVNDQQALEYLIDGVTGKGSIAAAIKHQKNAMLQGTKQTWAHPGIKGHPDLVEQGVSSGGKDNLKPGQSYMVDPTNGTVLIVGHNTKVTSHTDPILDKFAKSFNNSDTHLVVQTKDGPRVVSGDYAFKHLKDQIAKGTAKFIGGQYDGQSVAEVVGGGYAESNYKGVSTTKTSARDWQNVDQWEKTHKGNVTGSGGKVVIAPNPALAQLLNITATGNAVVANESAASGLVPRPGQYGFNVGGN